MEQQELYKMIDLMEEIKKVSSMISYHEEMESSDFMIGQYRTKLTMLLGKLVDQLASPPIQSPDSFSVIQQVLNKYNNVLSKAARKPDNEFDKLLAAM